MVVAFSNASVHGLSTDKSLVADIILQKPQHIIRCMAVVQFPLGHSPVRDMDELAKIFPVQSCAFPQLDNSVLTIHLSFLHKKQKYTLRNHYSIAAVNTQRVNCKFLRSLIRQRLCLITFLGMLHFLRGHPVPIYPKPDVHISGASGS